MRGGGVLVVGAAGFVGEAVLAELCRRGVPVTGLARREGGLPHRYPAARIRTADLSRLTGPADWSDLLAGQDAVIYAAGLLRPRGGSDPETMHGRVPMALAEAAERAGVRRLVHVSILGVEAPTRFARSRIEADTALAARRAPATLVVRPSLLVGRGASGGTALLRALAALPWRTPLIDGGRQRFQPLPLDHLATFLADALLGDEPTGIVEAVGPETLELREVLALYRGWLGLGPARAIAVPSRFARPLCRAGDALHLDPITTAALDQLAHGAAGAAPAPYAAHAATAPPPLGVWLAANPSTRQDRADAATWLLRPLLRVGLGVLWLASGLIGLASDPDLAARLIEGLTSVAPSDGVARAVWAVGCGFDIALGAALLLARDQRIVALAQIGLIVTMTLAFGVALRDLWLDPLGPLLKNLPLLLAAMVHLAWSRER